MFFIIFVPPRIYFRQIFVPNKLLISPMVPLVVCFSAKIVPLSIGFWEKLIYLRDYSERGLLIFACEIWAPTSRTGYKHMALVINRPDILLMLVR